MPMDPSELPDSLLLIIERDRILFEARDPEPDLVAARCALSFVYERTPGHMHTLADLWAAGPIPIPARGEMIDLHDVPVRVIDVRTQYSYTDDEPERKHADVFTIVRVEPASG